MFIHKKTRKLVKKCCNYTSCVLYYLCSREEVKKLKFTMKQAREYAGLSQREAAMQLGVALATYQGYEWGNVEMRIGLAKKFAKMVEIPLDQLIFYSKTS